MAWIQNLTNHAEKILNKIDERAAHVLNENPKDLSMKSLEDEFITIPEASCFEEQADQAWIETASSDKLANNDDPTKSEKGLNEALINVSVVSNEPITGENSSEICSELNSDLSKNASSVASISESNLQNSMDDTNKYIERISKLEFENEDLCRQLLNLQHLYSEIRNENSILKSNLERAHETVSSAENEMEQYKARTHRILLEREKLISEKRENINHESSEENIMINYNKELKEELKFQQNQNELLKEKVAHTTSELGSLQQQFIVMQNTLQQSNHKMESDLIREKKMLKSVEEELKVKSHELNQLHQRLNQKTEEATLKTVEVEKLQLELEHRSSIVGNEDLEYRIQNLTDMLMKNQNKLETITLERNALQVQLEKLENEYHRNLALARSSQPKIIHVNDTDDVKLQIPPMMRLSPSDAGVTRKMKHAYSSLDALSVKTGVFLKRYPGIRVFVFSYMVILHLWVLIILLNSTPSIK